MGILKKLGIGEAQEPASRPPPPTATFSGVRTVDEHFTPGAELDIEAYIAAGDLTGIHHLVRYQWAQEILRGRPQLDSLLDLGCGSGYGTFLLAQALPQTEVLGIDYDPNTVAEATRRYSLPNLTFSPGDPTDWESTIGGCDYGAITCFDVIEHVKHRELLLEGLVQHLRSVGWLLFSTPCGAGRNILNPGWEHHRIEFSDTSLYDLLRRYFGVVLRSDEPSFPGRAVFEELHKRGIEYLLRLNPVICREPIRIPNPYRA